MLTAHLDNDGSRLGCAELIVEDWQGSSLAPDSGQSIFVQLISSSNELLEDWSESGLLKGRMDSLCYYPLDNLRFTNLGRTGFKVSADEKLVEYIAYLGVKSFRCRVRDAAGNLEQADITITSELKLAPRAKETPKQDAAFTQAPKTDFAQSAAPKAAPESAPQNSGNKSVLLKIISIIGAIIILITAAILIKSLFFSASDEQIQSNEPQQAEEQLPAEESAAQEPASEENSAQETADPAGQEEPAEPAPEPEAQEAAQSTEIAVPVQTAAVPCTVAAGTSDAELLKKCMAASPNDVTLMNFTKEALQAKKCDLAARLLISRARSLSLDFALLYAGYLDPNSALTHECFAKNAEDAAYWYQKALEADANNAQAKQALKALQGGNQQ